jgi:hypothetical protein
MTTERMTTERMTMGTERITMDDYSEEQVTDDRLLNGRKYEPWLAMKYK